ncbi:hypothetical protein AURDEDRAFT_160722 [Auricularia subglabra TFB-10046 SS5]|nr:hypothetical protein AURDEDRAFT_160722 [Auricularia subglabra TFB-10046 SS5]
MSHIPGSLDAVVRHTGVDQCSICLTDTVARRSRIFEEKWGPAFARGPRAMLASLDAWTRVGSLSISIALWTLACRVLPVHHNLVSLRVVLERNADLAGRCPASLACPALETLTLRRDHGVAFLSCDSISLFFKGSLHLDDGRCGLVLENIVLEGAADDLEALFREVRYRDSADWSFPTYL